MKMLVSIASYNEGKAPMVRRLLENYESIIAETPIDLLDVFLYCNYEFSYPAEQINIYNKKSKLKGWYFTWSSRMLIIKNKDNYDLFIHSDDDILISPKSLMTFMDESSQLPENYIPGFLFCEEWEGEKHIINMHSAFGPGIEKYQEINEEKYFTPHNCHAACFVSTRKQLNRAIDSGNFYSKPRKKKFYPMPDFACSNIYVDCNLQNVIPCQRVEKFLAIHLPNKYMEKQANVKNGELEKNNLDYNFYGEYYSLTNLKMFLATNKLGFELLENDLVIKMELRFLYQVKDYFRDFSRIGPYRFLKKFIKTLSNIAKGFYNMMYARFLFYLLSRLN
jgi:hypothetical protein